eukprot:9330900-Pyramimonas_sp.AAC.1
MPALVRSDRPCPGLLEKLLRRFQLLRESPVRIFKRKESALGQLEHGKLHTEAPHDNAFLLNSAPLGLRHRVPVRGPSRAKPLARRTHDQNDRTLNLHHPPD